MFLLDPDIDFFYPSRIPDLGVKKAPDPGSATLAIDIFIKMVIRGVFRGTSYKVVGRSVLDPEHIFYVGSRS
jgi:hypothetical protein